MIIKLAGQPLFRTNCSLLLCRTLSAGDGGGSNGGNGGDSVDGGNDDDPY